MWTPCAARAPICSPRCAWPWLPSAHPPTLSLTPGKQADIAIVDLRSPHLEGFGDPVTMLGLCAGPTDVETVLVGGEFVKRDGKLVGPHVAQARDAMHETQQRLRPAARRYLP